MKRSGRSFADLTLLDPPTGAALRRALVQPAPQCGYRFEDDELVDEMLAEVEGERGALPLLAFAAARLWEKRDQRERASHPTGVSGDRRGRRRAGPTRRGHHRPHRRRTHSGGA